MSSLGIGGILHIADLLKKGKDARKIKVDNVTVDAQAHIKASGVLKVDIEATLPLDGNSVKVSATQQIQGDIAKITVGGVAATNPDIDLTMVHTITADIRVTMTFTHGNHNHVVVMYFPTL